MNVTFISQCQKNALKKTRRVLDAFANRIGDNVWRTVITEAGLKTVKKMLRSTASKNTAVACHWTRSRIKTEFLWVVGRKSAFNEVGNVPVNRTLKSIADFENDWHSLPSIKALSGLAALLHDWGKATALFQTKLRKKKSKHSDPLRHEWVSCLLFYAWLQSVGDLTSDEVWLTQLTQGNIDEKAIKAYLSKNEKIKFKQLPPVAQCILWLILSHHKLPVLSKSIAEKEYRGEPAENLGEILEYYLDEAWGYKNESEDKQQQNRLQQCFQFPKGLLTQSEPWLKQIKKWSQRLLKCSSEITSSMENGSYTLLLRLSRLSLMLGDYAYSSQAADPKWKSAIGLYANTDKATKNLKQHLDEHLVGVAKNAVRIAHFLPAFERKLPEADGILNLKKPSPKGFKWQDKAVQQIKFHRTQTENVNNGFFAINMASTGCGKTIANAKIMYALSKDHNSLRYILALGLRTLTLQTGNEYRQKIDLDDTELAVLIGSKAVMKLNETGSESNEDLLGNEIINYDLNIPEDRLASILRKPRDRKFLYAPVLACTIDHIMAAVETKRSGRYLLPTLRLMSSDLVIDEVDDFTGSDVIAIGRLIYLAGLLGRKVMISSATIPPDLAEGYFNAYQKGWHIYCKTRDSNTNIDCAWIDEFKTSVQTIKATAAQAQSVLEQYRSQHSEFVSKRIDALKNEHVRRKAIIVPCEYDPSAAESREEQYFSIIKKRILIHHKAECIVDKRTQRSVSWGVVRMANVMPCVSLSKYLLNSTWPENVDVKIMAYHSRQVLLLRHAQEQHLDAVLKRKEKKGEEPAALKNPIIRQHIDKSKAKHVIFILVATPIEEVGRDHDFDWGVIEPSSYRSIIQLVGRIRRHRYGAIEYPNVSLLQYNYKAFMKDDKTERCFFYPGYESSSEYKLKSHDLFELVDSEAMAYSIDAIPRIQRPEETLELTKLVDLEHKVMKDQLASYESFGPESLQAYLTQAWGLTALPQVLQPFRQNDQKYQLFLKYDQEKESCCFIEKDSDGHCVEQEKTLNINKDELLGIRRDRLWLERDYIQLLQNYSQEEQVSMEVVSLRYGELALNSKQLNRSGYDYSDQFGFLPTIEEN